MASDDCLNKKLLKADTVQKAYDTSQFLMKGSTDTDVHNNCILIYIKVLPNVAFICMHHGAYNHPYTEWP